MVGGYVIENLVTVQPETNRTVRTILCCSPGEGECSVYADEDQGKDIRPGDQIWWQCGKIMWHKKLYNGTYGPEIVIDKIGYSFS